jgi:hypothetical protein
MPKMVQVTHKYKLNDMSNLGDHLVRLISNVSNRPSPTTRSVPFSRVLIGGAQPPHGWWAPVASAI